MKKKKKIEWWPIAIIAAFILFGGGVISAVVTAFQQDLSLVTDEYYAEELVYQDQINKEILTRQLNKELTLNRTDGSEQIEILFPVKEGEGGKVSGELHFFRPSTSKSDFRIEIETDENGIQVIDLKGKEKGFWRLKVDWKEGSLPFYHEEEIII